jgi:hypothetical protein
MEERLRIFAGFSSDSEPGGSRFGHR